MDTRHNVGVQSAEPDVVMSTSPSPPPVSPEEPMVMESSPRRRLPFVLAAVILLAVAVVGIVVAGVLSGNDDDAVAKPVAQQPAQVPAPPAALALSVDGPSSATVGEPVEFTVTYSDGSGIFSGTVEEWGDGVGTSSLREGRCTAVDEAPGPLADTYRTSYTWTEPGTYTVVLGVHSYNCRGTTSVQEKATETLVLLVR